MEQGLQLSAKQFFSQAEVQGKFKEIMGKRASSFITSVLQIVSQNEMLSKADPVTIYQSAAVAATMDLPLNQNLGFAYIIPYKLNVGKPTEKVVAQFQMGYRGFNQLAQRSGQFKTMNSTDVRQGEIKNHNRLTGEVEFVWIQNQEERKKLPVVAYVSYFKLINGFEKTLIMYVAEVQEHGKKYSKAFNNTYGLWKTDFDAMALKTVTKLNLSKNAPLSIDLQNAVIFDQGVVKDADTLDVDYVDNDKETLSQLMDKTPEQIEVERWAALLGDCKKPNDLMKYKEQIPQDNPAVVEMYEKKLGEFLND